MNELHDTLHDIRSNAIYDLLKLVPLIAIINGQYGFVVIAAATVAVAVGVHAGRLVIQHHPVHLHHTAPHARALGWHATIHDTLAPEPVVMGGNEFYAEGI